MKDGDIIPLINPLVDFLLHIFYKSFTLAREKKRTLTFSSTFSFFGTRFFLK